MSYQEYPSLSNELMAGGERRREYEDFADRYEQGHPSEGYDDWEVMDRYRQVAQGVLPQDYEYAAQRSFERMLPDERVRFGQYVQRQARQQGYEDPAWDEDDENYRDSGYLSQVAGRMERQGPGMLGRIMSGGSDSPGDPSAKAALAGMAAFGAKRLMERS